MSFMLTRTKPPNITGDKMRKAADTAAEAEQLKVIDEARPSPNTARTIEPLVDRLEAHPHRSSREALAIFKDIKTEIGKSNKRRTVRRRKKQGRLAWWQKKAQKNPQAQASINSMAARGKITRKAAKAMEEHLATGERIEAATELGNEGLLHQEVLKTSRPIPEIEPSRLARTPVAKASHGSQFFMGVG
jgi:hypothetical protein